MKFVIGIQALVTVVGALLLWQLAGSQQGASFAVGSGVIVLSFYLLGIGYGLIFKKKMIALAISIIVFKYAILGIIIFAIAKLLWFDPLWFSMGVASFVLSAMSYAVKEALRKGNENGV